MDRYDVLVPCTCPALSLITEAKPGAHVKDELGASSILSAGRLSTAPAAYEHCQTAYLSGPRRVHLAASRCLSDLFGVHLLLPRAPVGRKSWMDILVVCGCSLHTSTDRRNWRWVSTTCCESCLTLRLYVSRPRRGGPCVFARCHGVYRFADASIPKHVWKVSAVVSSCGDASAPHRQRGNRRRSKSIPTIGLVSQSTRRSRDLTECRVPFLVGQRTGCQFRDHY